MRRDSSETKRKILTVCVRLFLERGYKNTTVSQIVDEAGVARGSYLNLFPTKDRILLELTETMFGGQFGVARSIADSKLPPVYAYAVETCLLYTSDSLSVTRKGDRQTLPRKEFWLLYKLLSYPDKIFTRTQLMDEIWGLTTETSQSTLNVHVNRLRNKFRKMCIRDRHMILVYYNDSTVMYI